MWPPLQRALARRHYEDDVKNLVRERVGLEEAEEADQESASNYSRRRKGWQRRVVAAPGVVASAGARVPATPRRPTARTAPSPRAPRASPKHRERSEAAAEGKASEAGACGKSGGCVGGNKGARGGR